MDAVRDAVVDYMNQYRVSSYDEGSGKGLVRHIYVRKGWVSGQLLVCLVVNGDKLPRQEALLERLQQIPGLCYSGAVRQSEAGEWDFGGDLLHPVRPGLD